ncbi:hypothetical protein M1590_04695 [Candidatus Marsarchaeota archaeon]|nr:hypothetical protein [Candidatus Marsarchaeota archaeon]
MDIFNIITYSINAIRKHPKFLLPTIIVTILGTIAGLILAAYIITSPTLLHRATTLSDALSAFPLVIQKIMPALAIFVVIFFFIGAFVQGTYVMLCSKWRSKEVSIKWAFGATSSRYMDLLLFSILIFAISAALIAIFLLPAAYIGFSAFSGGANTPPMVLLGTIFLMILLILLFAIAAVIVSVFLFVSIPLILLKRRGPLQALKESYAICRKDFANILVLLIANAILIGAIEVVGSMFQVIPIIGTIIYIIISIFVSSYSQMIPTMYYIEIYKKK